MTARISNITIYSENPAALARFWCGVMGYPEWTNWPDDEVAELRASGMSDDDIAARAEAWDHDPAHQRFFFQRYRQERRQRNRMDVDVTVRHWRRCSCSESGLEMPDAKVGDEFVEWLAAQIVVARAPGPTPVGEGVQDRDGLDAGLGEAVPSAGAARGRSAGEDACLDEPHESVGEDVRRDALGGPGEQSAEEAAVLEDDVAQDEQRPAIAEYIGGGTDPVHDPSLTVASPSI